MCSWITFLGRANDQGCSYFGLSNLTARLKQRLGPLFTRGPFVICAAPPTTPGTRAGPPARRTASRRPHRRHALRRQARTRWQEADAQGHSSPPPPSKSHPPRPESSERPMTLVEFEPSRLYLGTALHPPGFCSEPGGRHSSRCPFGQLTHRPPRAVDGLACCVGVTRDAARDLQHFSVHPLSD